MNPHRIGAARQRGISLIEILVAVVLLAVGLLGLAGLQLRGMQVNQGSQWRSMAAVMADDLADRMRAELDLTATPSSPPTGATFVAGSPYGVGSVSGDASLTSWLQASLSQLPAGATPAASIAGSCPSLPCVSVSVVPGSSSVGTPSAVQIVIYWNDYRAYAGSSLTPGGTTTPPAASVGYYQVVSML